MVSRVLGDEPRTQLLPLPLEADDESAYAVYTKGTLARIAVLNLEVAPTSAARPGPKSYSLPVPHHFKGAKVERLEGPGSYATTNISYGGYSYDYEAGLGTPVPLKAKLDEFVRVTNGKLHFDVPASSAILLTLF